MPDEPRREKIMAAVADQLATIAGPPRYWTTPVLITRGLLGPEQYEAELRLGPVLGVMRASGSTITPLTQTSVEHRALVAVVGYVRGDTQALAATWLERLYDDVRACLREDAHLGGLALDVRPEGPLLTDDGLWEPDAGFEQLYLVRFVESAG